MAFSKYFTDEEANLIAHGLDISPQELDSKIENDPRWKKDIIEFLPMIDTNNQIYNRFLEKYNKAQYEKSEQGKREAERKRKAEEEEDKRQKIAYEKERLENWNKNPENVALAKAGKPLIPLPPEAKPFIKIDPKIEGKGNQLRDAIQQSALDLAQRKDTGFYYGKTLATDTEKRKALTDLYKEREDPASELNKADQGFVEDQYLSVLADEPIGEVTAPQDIRDTVKTSHLNKLRKDYHSPYEKELEKLEKRHRKYVTELAPYLAKRFSNSPGVRFHSGDENYEKQLIQKANKSLLNKKELLLEKNYKDTAALASAHIDKEMQAERDVAHSMNLSTHNKLQRIQGLDQYKTKKRNDLKDYIDTTKRYEHDELVSENAEIQEKIKKHHEAADYPHNELMKLKIIAGDWVLPVSKKEYTKAPEILLPPPSSSGLSTLGTGLMGIGSGMMQHPSFQLHVGSYRTQKPGYPYRKGGRVHKADGGMLKAAVDNAVVNRIPTLESLENLERSLALHSLEKRIQSRAALKEGGSPIQQGAVQAKHVALLDSLQKRADKMRSPHQGGNGSMVGSMIEGAMRAWAATNDPYMGKGAHAYMSGVKAREEGSKHQENREDKAADIEHELAKLSLGEEKDRRHLDNEKEHIEAQKEHYKAQEAHYKALEGLHAQKTSGEKPLTSSQTTALGKADEAIGSSQHMQHLIERQKGLSKKIGNHPLLGRLVSGASDLPYVGGLLAMIPETILSHISHADRADIIEWDKNNAAIVAASQGIAKNLPRSSVSIKLIEAGKMRLGEDKANQNIAEGLMGAARVAENSANNTYERITGASPVTHQEPPQTEDTDRLMKMQRLQELYKKRDLHKKLGGLIARHASFQG